jgi:hypothetical protein
MKQHNVNTTIDSCRFNNLTDSQAKDAIIISTEADFAANATIRFVNNVVTNFQNAGSSSSQGAIVHNRNFKFTGINNTFVNLSIPSGNGFLGMYGVDNGPLVNLSLTNDSFRNVSNRANGGVIHTISTKNFTLASCTFELCTTTAKGGVVYITNTAMFTFFSCRYYSNNAAGGGNEICHQLNLYDSYSSASFVVTCSDSANDKITFPDGRNLNNLLLCMCIIVIVDFLMFIYFSNL